MNIGANDKFFFLLSYHGKAAVMQYSFMLREDIDVAALNKAAPMAVEAFPLFGLRPVVERDGKLIMEEDHEEILISRDDSKNVCLGSDDTNGYLFRITYSDRCIKIVASHAIGDGRSILSFSITLLYYYLLETGRQIDTKGMVYTIEDKNDPTLTDNLFDRLKEVDTTAGQSQSAPLDRFFYSPEEKIYMGTPDTRRLVLSWDQNRFMEIVRSEGATPLIFVHDLITRTMYEYYGLNDKTIIAFVPIDLREKLESRSQANFTFNVDLWLDKELLDKPAKERYESLKSMLRTAGRLENIAATVDAVRPLYEELNSMSFNDVDRLENLLDLSNVTKSYLLSNIGMIRMPDDIEKYVADVDIYFSAREASPVYSMLTFANKGMLIIGQNYEETGLIEALGNKFTELGIPCKLEDQGILKMDDLDIRRFKHR
jgi:NRPS condensation-like uncharacterized protein